MPKGSTGASTSSIHYTAKTKKRIGNAIAKRMIKTAFWKGERDALMKMAREGDERAAKELFDKYQIKIIKPEDEG